ncbi:grasp-with-spasm system SPASM domain peptide maturase [Tenacibaculum ascidiaceicola]|uniref:grasp-with-spasm system SPASM domain peptide maturase n=1 Tax=Tenacibaculum ascidiaceicola TaxID=1699411 RepID=UPI003894134F
MNTVFCLFSNCIPIKGFRRSIIYDLTRFEYQFIPNSLYDILNNFNGKSINFIKEKYKDHGSTIDEYFNFLLENDYIFFCKEKEIKRFPKLNYTWDYPGEISNCIFEIEDSFSIDIKTLITNLKSLGCNHIHLFYKTSLFEMDQLINIISIINRSPFKSIEISIPFDKDININLFNIFCQGNLNVSEVNFYNSPYEKKSRLKNTNTRLTYQPHNKYLSDKKETFNFHVDMNLFMESQKHNTFFNRKLIVSSLGFFTNSIKNNRHKWWLHKDSLTKVIHTDKFRENWFSNKDSIKICKDCEFRYMCVDNRTPVKDDKKNEWYFDTKCSYNPYEAKWDVI